tara:strand:- start:32 stop:325 length:294 start_codon:yes stop_codon:yes gene_type:complete
VQQLQVMEEQVELEQLHQLMELQHKDLVVVAVECIVLVDLALERQQVVGELVEVDLLEVPQRQLLEQITLVVEEADMVELILVIRVLIVRAPMAVLV